MNAADVVIAIILIIGLLSGLTKGFVRGLFSLLALVLGIMIAASTYERIATSLLASVPGDRAPEIVSFALIFLVVVVAIGLLGRIISKALKLASLGWLDRLLGGLLGIVTAAIVAALLLLFAVMAGFQEQATLKESRLAPNVLRLTDIIVSFVPEDARQHFEKGYEGLRESWNSAPEPDDSQDSV